MSTHLFPGLAQGHLRKTGYLVVFDGSCFLRKGRATRMSDVQLYAEEGLPRSSGLTKLAALAFFGSLIVAGGALLFTRRPVRDLAKAHFQGVSKATAKEVCGHLNPALPVIKDCLTQAEHGFLPVDEPERLAVWLIDRQRVVTTLAWLSYSDHATGRFVGVRRRDDGEIVLNRSDPAVNGGRPTEVLVHADGRYEPLPSPVRDGYDPRKGGWYALALQSDGPVWTRPFKFNEGVMGITLAAVYRPEGSAEPKGVFTADFALGGISRFLDGLKGKHKGLLFVLDRDGSILAAPTSQDVNLSRKVLKKVVHREGARLRSLGAGQSSFADFRLGHVRWLANVDVFAVEGGLEAALVCAVAERDLAGGDALKSKLMVGLGMAAILAALALAAFLIHRLRRAALAASDTTASPSIVLPNRGFSAGTADLSDIGSGPPTPAPPARFTPDSRYSFTFASRGSDVELTPDNINSIHIHDRNGSDLAVDLTVGVEDLSADKLLLSAPRLQVSGYVVPAPSGIPLLAQLGQGGMATVYFGVHPRLRKPVAVKVLSFLLAQKQPDWVKRFVREAQLAAQVQSSHLVGVLDVNEEEGLHYLVMEYVRGESAGSYLLSHLQRDEGGLPEREALDICAAATKGLTAAHELGIIHRDIKPDNILIPRDPAGEHLRLKQAKLSDLGIARYEEAGGSVTEGEMTMGTAGYISPEQIHDAKTAGKPADVFSMGATLYALLTGKPAFSGASPLNTVIKTIQEPHEPITDMRPDVSKETVALVDRCLSKEAQERYADGAELLKALLACRDSFA